MLHHPMIKYALDETKFDMKKFYEQVLMAVAVGTTVYILKQSWFKFTGMEKK